MDPFSALDDFMCDPVDGSFQHDSPKQCDVQNVESIGFGIQKTVKSKSKSKSKPIVEEEETKKKKEFVPVRGQKQAYNKLKKIKDSLPVEVEVVENTKKVTRKKRAASAPQKQKRDYDTTDSSSADEDTAPVASSRRRDGSRMPAYINLDSEDEFGNKPIAINRNLASDSTALQSTDNEEIKVAVKYGLRLNYHMMRPFQKLTDLIAKVAAQYSKDASTVFLMMDGKILSATSTLHSIEYFPGLVISVHTSDQTANLRNNKLEGTKKKKNDDEIAIRIQSEIRKKPFNTHMFKTDNISALIFQCAEEFGCDSKKIKLEFDGEMLSADQTPDECEFEDGIVLDMFIAK